MSELHETNIDERLQRLEQYVSDLQRKVARLDTAIHDDVSRADTISVMKTPKPVPKTDTQKKEKSLPMDLPVSHRAPRREISIPEVFKTGEFWLNKIGIGLLLFGVVFLFKYSIDQGWITPLIRVICGLVIGLILLFTGLRLYKKRRYYSQVLLGGAIATFYISGFAAFQLYALVPYPVALIFMVGVTLLAFFLSIRQNEAALSLIGMIGGLGTPFLLYTDVGSIPGLIGYTCLVLGGAGAVYFYKSWRSLLWLSVVGGWIVLGIGLAEGLFPFITRPLSDQVALQIGVVYTWLVFWLLPVVREILATNNPSRWAHQPAPWLKTRTVLNSPALQVTTLTVFLPLLALMFSMEIWSIPQGTWGWICMGGAMMYSFVCWGLQFGRSLKSLAYTHAVPAILLLTIGFCLLLEGDVLFFTLASEAALIHLMGRRLSSNMFRQLGHLFFGILGIWLFNRLMIPQAETPVIINGQALSDLWFIALAVVVPSLFISTDERNIYRFAGHLVFLAWILRELYTLPSGHGYITIAWGVYALVLLLVGLRLGSRQLRAVAIGTLLLVVGKLFVVDLAHLKAMWRILLFMGFGSLFLVISYYFHALWRKGRENGNGQ